MNLKQLLLKHGISQTELAQMLGRDKSVITNLFQGKRQLKADEARVIARHLGVPVAEVLGEPHGLILEEPQALIPFQHEPRHNKKVPGIIRKDGKFFLKTDQFTANPEKTYALEMPDEAMNLAGILPGDILISELDREWKAGQTVIVQRYLAKGASTIIRKYEPPFLLAHSTLPNYPPLNADEEEVRIVSPVLKLIRLM